MSEIINAKGLACPQPVILTKKALDSQNDVTVLVDNTTAVENIKRLASSSGCSAEVAEEPGGIYKIRLKKQAGAAVADAPGYLSCSTGANPGPNVFVISSDTMGKGSDELGSLLIKAFIHTAIELENRPDVMIFYNTGVKFTAQGSDTLDDLKNLEARGVKILVCGTCANFFNIKEKVAAGIVSNMYDIADTLSRAGRIVQP
ncbi:MAG: sulfurtransferase-like selenium metabolism protein YedF [Spirochaetes bacterium]|nr:sulfurtransferase-like selenium metabolism protein YedF [Spirochaetota bacterium]